jgi:hypothetical protein
MRLSQPRIAAAADNALTLDQRRVLEPLGQRGPVLNIFRTMARAPEALTAFLAWGSYILSRRNALPERERELVILRVGFLCKAGYEWGQHVIIGLRAGLTEAEIPRIKQGAEAPGWSPADRALLAATDQLVKDHFVQDAAWADLKSHFDEKACMDFVYTVGQYTQVSMVLNTFGVQLDEGMVLAADLKGF